MNAPKLADLAAVSMSYTIAKENIGTPRTFKTQGALERALLRAGAKGIEIHQDYVRDTVRGALARLGAE